MYIRGIKTLSWLGFDYSLISLCKSRGKIHVKSKTCLPGIRESLLSSTAEHWNQISSLVQGEKQIAMKNLIGPELYYNVTHLKPYNYAVRLKRSYSPVGWGCRIPQLHRCRGIRPTTPTSVRDVTLNSLIVSLESCSLVRVSARSRPSPPLYPHFNRPSILVGGSDKYMEYRFIVITARPSRTRGFSTRR